YHSKASKALPQKAISSNDTLRAYPNVAIDSRTSCFDDSSLPSGMASSTRGSPVPLNRLSRGTPCQFLTLLAETASSAVTFRKDTITWESISRRAYCIEHGAITM